MEAEQYETVITIKLTLMGTARPSVLEQVNIQEGAITEINKFAHREFGCSEGGIREQINSMLHELVNAKKE